MKASLTHDGAVTYSIYCSDPVFTHCCAQPKAWGALFVTNHKDTGNSVWQHSPLLTETTRRTVRNHPQTFERSLKLKREKGKPKKSFDSGEFPITYGDLVKDSLGYNYLLSSDVKLTWYSLHVKSWEQLSLCVLDDFRSRRHLKTIFHQSFSKEKSSN